MIDYILILQKFIKNKVELLLYKLYKNVYKTLCNLRIEIIVK